MCHLPRAAVSLPRSPPHHGHMARMRAAPVASQAGGDSILELSPPWKRLSPEPGSGVLLMAVLCLAAVKAFMPWLGFRGRGWRMTHPPQPPRGKPVVLTSASARWRLPENIHACCISRRSAQPSCRWEGSIPRE